jgi:hypothetical protein
MLSCEPVSDAAVDAELADEALALAEATLEEPLAALADAEAEPLDEEHPNSAPPARATPASPASFNASRLE